MNQTLSFLSSHNAKIIYMKFVYSLLFILCGTLSFSRGHAQEDWPKTITATDGTIIKVFQPQAESFSDNTLKARAAISILSTGQTDPSFGTFWMVANVETDRDERIVSLISVSVPNLKMATAIDADRTDYLKKTLEAQLPQAAPDIPMDELLASLEMNQQAKKLSKDLNTTAPKIIYTKDPSLLVVIDGKPRLQHNNDWGLDVVVNSPFTIVKNTDGNFYLYGDKHWYIAPAPAGPFSYTDNVPANLQKVADAVNSANNSDPGYSAATDSAGSDPNVINDIIVTTTPAELIQSKGDPVLSPVDGTQLSYVSNSNNDIFYNNADNQYYVLLSGRWYASPKLNNGSWQYVASNNLPPDFAKIPEGSQKDNVLASVAGTDAAREAVMDAQIPQTAKVDRHNATTEVTYDGDPRFEPISGTHMQYAVNTQSTVLQSNGEYYTVDKGVWFVSNSPTGPWAVATERPGEVDKIPPSNPTYNTKYVDIYGVDPDWVYMGYTPGYLNAYIYGPTVVYGTGYYYAPWVGAYYYPHPYTWGFAMHYNPWAGWCFGFGYSYGWFNIGFGYSPWHGWCGGWWGPPVYHPPYHWGYYNHGGYYGHNTAVVNRNTTIINNHVSYTNNIYNYRRDVVAQNNNRFANTTHTSNGNGFAPNGSRPVMNNNRPANTGGAPVNGARPNSNNNVYSDRQGNIYQRNSQGQWQQRQNHSWQPVNNNPSVSNMNRESQMRDRGQMRTQNFQQARPSFTAPRSSGGGGARPSGGGGARPSSGGRGGGGGRH
jgi:hypothetical protein